MKSCLLALVFCCCFACHSGRVTHYDLSQSRELPSPKIIYTTQDSGALRHLLVRDSLLLLIADGKNPFILVNRHSGQEMSRFNDGGLDSAEYSRPSLLVNNLIVNADTPNITFYDAVRGKFLNLDLVRLLTENTHSWASADYPEKMERSVNLNLADHKIIGTETGATRKGMFFIYDSLIERMNWVGYYPDYGLDEAEDRGCVYHSKIAANGDSNSVVCGMAWMDMVHIYTMSGVRTCTYSFSEEVNLVLDQDGMPQADSTLFFSSVFPTAEHCYLLRKGYVLNGVEEKRDHLIQLDWEGNMVNTYLLDGELTDFCIDEKQHKLFGLRCCDDESKDHYQVLEYSLQES